MGTQESVQVVKQGYAAFGRGDIQGLLQLLADDVEWVVPGSVPPSGTYRGHAGVGQFFQALTGDVETLAFEPREFLADGDRVAVIGWERVKVRSTNRVVENNWVMTFTVRNGKVTNYRNYADTDAWTKAHETTAGAGA